MTSTSTHCLEIVNKNCATVSLSCVGFYTSQLKLIANALLQGYCHNHRLKVTKPVVIAKVEKSFFSKCSGHRTEFSKL